MAEVLKICICKNSGEEMQDLDTIEVLADKGIINDRYFNENNDQDLQITLIESENIDYYNNKFKTNYSYLDFRRNVVTKGIELNNLVGKKLSIGSIKIEGHDLCRPCKHLEETLNGKDIIKEFLRRGGLRCEILTSGIINLQDKITIL